MALTERDGENPKLLDIATIDEEWGPQLLTNGFTEFEEKVFANCSSAAFQIKMLRERTFPLEVLSKGLVTELEKAESHEAKDKRRILNKMACRLEERPVT